jgi:transcriptional regulator with XRE-family HTH domain
VEGGIPELERLGAHLLAARTHAGLSQSALAARCALTQTQISYFEQGRRKPTLPQFVRLARALDIPVQWLLSGSFHPGDKIPDITVELRHLGIVDLWSRGATVPGAFRRPEEVVTLAVAGQEPNPRIVEAIPAVLAWNPFDPILLRAHGVVSGTALRLAWLADITLASERQKGFPGGCRKQPLEQFLEDIRANNPTTERAVWDTLGKPKASQPTSPIWKRWRVTYDASLDQFENRARHLDTLRHKTPEKQDATATRRALANRSRKR